MKRIFLAVAAAVALFAGGLMTSSAQAHGPGYVCGPSYGHHHHHHHGHRSYNVYGPRFAPYGVGYSGGWQPYSAYYRQPGFGLYIGY
jgi:hypothetical protein